MCFYLPNTLVKKKSQEEIGLRSKKEPKQGKQGPDLLTFLTAKLGRLGRAILALRCDRGVGDMESPRKGKMGTRTPHHRQVEITETTLSLLEDRRTEMVACGDLS